MIIFMTQEKLKKKFKHFMIADLNRAIERKEDKLKVLYEAFYEKKQKTQRIFGSVEYTTIKDDDMSIIEKSIEETKNEIKIHKIMFEALGSYVF